MKPEIETNTQPEDAAMIAAKKIWGQLPKYQTSGDSIDVASAARIIREAYAGEAKPTCPQCGEPMELMMRRISENSQSGVKLLCKGPELSYHEFRIFSLADFAQFFRGASPSDELVKVLRRLGEWNKKHPKAYVMSEGGLRECEKELDDICASAERILKTLK